MGLKGVWVLNAQTRSPNRPSLKYSSGGSGLLWKWNQAFCLPTSGGSGQYIVVYGQMKSTSTPVKSTGETIMEVKKVGNLYKGQNGEVFDPQGISPTLRAGTTNNPKHGGIGSSNSPKIIVKGANSMKETSPKSKQQTFPTMTCSSADSPVKRLVSLENAGDLTILEALSFLRSHESVEQKSQDIYYLKTSRAYLVTTKEIPSRRSLKFSPTLGIFYNGKFSIVRTTPSHRIGKECSLSDILEEHVDQKYFLSEKMVKFLMRNNVVRPEGYKPLTKKDKTSYTLTSRYWKMGKTDPFISED